MPNLLEDVGSGDGRIGTWDAYTRCENATRAWRVVAKTRQRRTIFVDNKRWIRDGMPREKPTAYLASMFRSIRASMARKRRDRACGILDRPT